MAKQQRLPIIEAALKGALAGAVGGAAMLVAEALASRHVLSRVGSAPDEWARVAGSAARRGRFRLTGKKRAATGFGLHIVYSAAIGALYGVARSRGLSRPAAGLLDGGLLYAAYRAEEGFRGRSRRRGRSSAKRGRLPLDADQIFAIVTSKSFGALADGRD